MRDAPRRLHPDFIRCSVVVMRAPVVLVGVLIGIEILLRFGSRNLLRLADSAVRAFTGVGVDDIGAIGAKNPFAFL